MRCAALLLLLGCAGAHPSRPECGGPTGGPGPAAAGDQGNARPIHPGGNQPGAAAANGEGAVNRGVQIAAELGKPAETGKAEAKPADVAAAPARAEAKPAPAEKVAEVAKPERTAAIAQELTKPDLNKIMVKTEAIEAETGKRIEITERADKALAGIDHEMQVMKELMGCLG